MFEDVYVVVVSKEEESQVTIVSLLQAKVEKAARIVFAATRGTEDSEIGIQDSHQMCLRLVSLLLTPNLCARDKCYLALYLTVRIVI